mmetsp:Transcript_21906/g.35213  ORF Transcript_21906/g.35213 Transcript_21906/m.35213 type:complete len:101 (+) Transcript_21906:278-580(+)
MERNTMAFHWCNTMDVDADRFMAKFGGLMLLSAVCRYSSQVAVIRYARVFQLYSFSLLLVSGPFKGIGFKAAKAAKQTRLYFLYCFICNQCTYDRQLVDP